MRNSYIKIPLNENNEFKTKANLSFKGIDYNGIEVKIDTGCGHSSFPVARFGINQSDAYQMKIKDCEDKSVKKAISFGVNDSKRKREEDKINYRQGKFI